MQLLGSSLHCTGWTLGPVHREGACAETGHAVPFPSTSASCRCCSAAQSCLTLCDPMDCITLGSHVLHHLPELAQTQVHWVGDAKVPYFCVLCCFEILERFIFYFVLVGRTALQLESASWHWAETQTQDAFCMASWRPLGYRLWCCFRANIVSVAVILLHSWVRGEE